LSCLASVLYTYRHTHTNTKPYIFLWHKNTYIHPQTQKQTHTYIHTYTHTVTSWTYGWLSRKINPTNTAIGVSWIWTHNLEVCSPLLKSLGHWNIQVPLNPKQNLISQNPTVWNLPGPNITVQNITGPNPKKWQNPTLKNDKKTTFYHNNLLYSSRAHWYKLHLQFIFQWAPITNKKTSSINWDGFSYSMSNCLQWRDQLWYNYLLENCYGVRSSWIIGIKANWVIEIWEVTAINIIPESCC